MSASHHSSPSHLCHVADQEAIDFFTRSEGSGSVRSTSVQEVQSEAEKLPSGEPADQANAINSTSTAPQTDEVTELTADDAPRDAGNGKVRGSNGRFLTKPGSIPRKARKSTGSKRKGGRKCKQAHKLDRVLDSLTNNLQQA